MHVILREGRPCAPVRLYERDLLTAGLGFVSTGSTNDEREDKQIRAFAIVWGNFSDKRQREEHPRYTRAINTCGESFVEDIILSLFFEIKSAII